MEETKNMTEELSKLKRMYIANGRLDDDDVARPRIQMFDGKMTPDKGEFMFSLKDTVKKELGREDVSPRFKDLFVEVISSLLLEDENSPGEIEEKEAKWLRAKIQSNTVIDEYDRALLKDLRLRSINYPSILNYKSQWVIKGEKILYCTRYLTLLAVACSLVSAAVLFIKGMIIVWDALKLFVSTIVKPTTEAAAAAKGNKPGCMDYESLLEMFVSSVDIFLFAMVLVIFGVGIYELFISKIDPVLQKASGRPTWMQINNVDDLKSSLGKVILMVLIVSFFKHSIEISYNGVDDLLKLGLGIVLVALAPFITSRAHSK